MQLVVNALNKTGHDTYCPLFDEHKSELQAKNDIKAIFTYAFENVKKCEAIVAIVTSKRKSEGQLMEVGAMSLPMILPRQ